MAKTHKHQKIAKTSIKKNLNEPNNKCVKKCRGKNSNVPHLFVKFLFNIKNIDTVLRQEQFCVFSKTDSCLTLLSNSNTYQRFFLSHDVVRGICDVVCMFVYVLIRIWCWFNDSSTTILIPMCLPLFHRVFCLFFFIQCTKLPIGAVFVNHKKRNVHAEG